MKLGEAWVYINGDDKPLQGVFRRSRREAEGWAHGVARSVKGILTGALSTAAGFVLAQVGIRALGDVVRGVRGAIFDMNATLETSSLQFETLIGDADGAREHVKMLFEVAKETPFETGPIIEASRQLRAYGRDALDTRDNLILIGDAAAATSAPIEEVGRWVGRLYSNLQGGRPFGEAAQRLQELAILSPEARLEMERLQAAGASADEVFAVLERDLGRFTGAMKAQANTWQGVTATIKDSLQLLGATALKPLFDLARQVAITLADLLDRPEVERGAEEIAAALQRIIDRVKEMARVWVDRLGTVGVATARVLGRVAGYMSVFATYAYSWGLNIGEMLAKGLLLAVNAVTMALSVLGAVISGLLRPGSPPRLLPELDQWGKGAAEVYLEGWTQADFSALQAFGGTVAEMLRGLAVAGRLDEMEVVPRTMGLRQTFAEILHQVRETGEASEELYAAIREGAGDAGPELEELARRYARVADAQGRLSDVERRLRALRGEQQQRQDAARLSELAAIMADPRATAGQKERAAREREIIGLLTEQRELQGEVDEAEAELAAFQSRLDVERETISLLGQQRGLLESLVDKLKEALDPLTQAVRGWQLQQAELRDLVRLAEIEHRLATEDLTVAQRTALELERQAIQAERLVRAREAAEVGVELSGLAQIPIVPEDFLSQVGGALSGEGGLGETIENALREVEEQLEGFDLTELLTKLDEMRNKFDESFAQAQADAQALIDKLPDADATIQPLIDALVTLNERLAELGPRAREAGGGIVEALRPARDFVAENLHPILAGIGAMLIKVLGPGFVAWAGTAISSAGATVAALAPVAAVTLGIGAAVGLLVAAWERDWLGIRTAVTTAWQEDIRPALVAMGATIRDETIPAVESLAQGALSWLAEAGASVADVWSGSVLPVLQDVWGWIDQYLLPIFRLLADIIRLSVEVGFLALAAAWRNHLRPAFEQFWALLTTYVLPVVRALLQGALWPLQVAFAGIALVWNQALKPAFRTLGTFLEETVGPALKRFRENVIDKLTEALGFLGDKLVWLKEKLEAAKGVLEGVRDKLAGGGEEPPQYQAGTSYHRGGLALVGELGPELVRLPRGSAVFSSGLSQRLLQAAGAGDVIVNVGPVTLASDLDVEELAYRVAAVVQRRGR